MASIPSGIMFWFAVDCTRRCSGSLLKFLLYFLYHQTEITTDKLAVYVTSHKRAIKNSVTQWKKQRDSGIHTVTYWLRSHSRENETVIDNIHTRRRQQMLNGQRHDQQRKRKKQDTTNGATIVDYFQRYTNNQNHYQSTPQNSPQRESRSLLSIRSEVL